MGWWFQSPELHRHFDFSAAMPCFFVAKMEIVGWPFFGKAARSGGTIFVDRSSLASALTVAEQMTSA